MGVLLKELLTLYHTGVAGATDTVLPVQYKDYACWQQNQLSSGALDTDKSYWLEQLSGPLPVLELPTDYPRPSVKNYQGSSIVQTIEGTLVEGLKRVVTEEDSTLFMGLVTVLNVLLYRYSGQEDIIIGSPVAGRNHADLEDQIGFYVNMVALRSRFNGSNSYRELLRHVRQVSLEAYEHQVYPFDELVDDLHLQRDTSRHPLFDVLIVLQNVRSKNIREQIKLSDINVYEYQSSLPASSKYDLTFSFEIEGEGLQMRIEYNTNIYSEDFVQRMSDHFMEILRCIPQHDSDIGSLNYLPSLERELQISKFNGFMGLTLFLRRWLLCLSDR